VAYQCVFADRQDEASVGSSRVVTDASGGKR
jgi:hypothetical protein